MEPIFDDVEFDLDSLLDDKLKQTERQQPKRAELLRMNKCRIVQMWLRNVLASLIIGNQTQWSVIQLGNDGARWQNYQLRTWLGAHGASAEWASGSVAVQQSELRVETLCREGTGRELGKAQLVWWCDDSCQIDVTPACQSEAHLATVLKNVADMLEDGGYLVGQCFDSSELFARLAKQSMVPNQPRHLFRISERGRAKGEEARVARVTFVDEATESGALPLVGAQFSLDIHDSERRYAPCYLLHFPTLLRLARAVGLRMVSITNCTELYDEHCKTAFVESLNELLVEEHRPFTFGHETAQRELLQLYAIFVFVKAAPVPDL